MPRILSFAERIEKVRISASNPHLINENGLNNLKEAFENKETDFEDFIQFVFANGFKEGMLHSIKIMSDSYDR